ncbi:MAG: NAD(P)H-hydrate epimerase, partial [Balneolaceae bacterium]|nr:NAD(P)H-hydrate epimerase [Balneolaceae bacterium]
MNIPTPPLNYFLCTAGQSQQMDARTIDQFGIDGYTLMEVAGSSAAGHLRAKFSPGCHGLYLCGKGNNAGDALVVARYLVQHGIGATIVLISGDEELSTDTDKNLELLQKIAENDPNAAETVIIPAWDQFDPNRSADFIIDGMLGTGLDSELRGDYQKAVSWVNDSALPVISIDIPTGLHADTGEVMGEAVIAQETYSFGTLKQGFYLGEGPLCTGKVIFCELPFPNYLKECDTYLIDEQWVPEPVNPPARHKYEAGVLYIVAGSEGLTGAAIMTAESA